MVKAFKNTALYVSAIIGAGFASGSEIALFFKEQGVVVVIAAGLLLGGFAAIFIRIGGMLHEQNEDALCERNGVCGKNGNGAFREKSGVLRKKNIGGVSDFFDIFPRGFARVLRAVFLVSSFVTLAAMTAGAEDVFFGAFGLKYTGIISLIPAVVLGLMKTDGLKSFFSALVIIIIGLIAFLFFKSGEYAAPSGFNFLTAVSYASMNVFLGGYLIAKPKKAEKNEALFTGIFSALIITALLLMIYKINGSATGEMPVVTAAAAVGCKKAAAAIIFLAVFSTMISTSKTLLNFAKKRYGNAASAAALITCAFCVSLIGFDRLVRGTYPAISLFSSAFAALTVVRMIRYSYGERIAERIKQGSARARS
ncbi:MAG: hypothetical protein LBP79_07380 [Clostridiales bacterium]|nr:hypothetical protein [Clostridiales bacterium]